MSEKLPEKLVVKGTYVVDEDNNYNGFDTEGDELNAAIAHRYNVHAELVGRVKELERALETNGRYVKALNQTLRKAKKI